MLRGPPAPPYYPARAGRGNHPYGRARTARAGNLTSGRTRPGAPGWGGQSPLGPHLASVQLQRWAVYDHRTSLDDCRHINTAILLRSRVITRISGPADLAPAFQVIPPAKAHRTIAWYSVSSAPAVLDHWDGSSGVCNQHPMP